MKNILYCLDNGTEIGWLIDPNDNSVFIYFAQQKTLLFEAENDILSVPDFAKSFNLTVGELWAFLL